MNAEILPDAFLDRLAACNPFLENRINGTLSPAADVLEIHRKAFERLVGLAHQALAARRALGVVLWGEAGIGKSHLLARLAGWAESGQAHLVYLHNLQAAPDALPRSLLAAVVGVLSLGRRARFGATPLFSLAHAGVVEAMGGPGRFSWPQLEQGHGRWLDRLGPAAGDRLIHEVLFSFFHSVHQSRVEHDDRIATLAVRWLSGGALDPAEARQLRLPPALHRDDAVALADAQQVKQVLVALCRLAASQNRPFILALDQVDNLDEDQFAALTRFLEALLDTAPNLLVITTGIQTTLARWHDARVVQASAWDRIDQFTVRLEKLTPAQAELLVRRRLDAFLADFTGSDPIDRLRQQDDLFPLGRSWSRNLLERLEIRPRDVISQAREGWQEQQDRLAREGRHEWLRRWPGDGRIVDPDEAKITPQQRLALIDQRVYEEVETLKGRLEKEQGLLPIDEDRLAELLYQLLSQCQGLTAGFALEEVLRIPPPRRNTPPTYHLSLRSKVAESDLVTGVLVMATGAKQAVTGFLGRLCEDSRPLDRVVIVTDQRIGMPLGPRGGEYLADLKSRGPGRFSVHELSFEERVELEALAQTVARARSGDVEIDLPGGRAEAITAEEVIASHHRHRRYQARPLLKDLLEMGTTNRV